eukprot:2583015-Prymnesium_polylepis.2
MPTCARALGRLDPLRQPETLLNLCKCVEALPQRLGAEACAGICAPQQRPQLRLAQDTRCATLGHGRQARLRPSPVRR